MPESHADSKIFAFSMVYRTSYPDFSLLRKPVTLVAKRPVSSFFIFVYLFLCLVSFYLSKCKRPYNRDTNRESFRYYFHICQKSFDITFSFFNRCVVRFFMTILLIQIIIIYVHNSCNCIYVHMYVHIHKSNNLFHLTKEYDTENLRHRLCYILIKKLAENLITVTSLFNNYYIFVYKLKCEIIQYMSAFITYKLVFETIIVCSINNTLFDM